MHQPFRHQRGASMIEVLVTIVIIAFGLLGMAGLQSRLQVSEMESYQRAQALVLLSDMANRITVNRHNAAGYNGLAITPTTTCSTTYAGTTALLTDEREWCNAVQGAGETIGTSNLGTVVGGRGCVAQLASGDYMVTVAWQGMVPLNAPPASVTCGANAYDVGGTTGCTNDLCRRFVTTVVRIAPLE